MQALQDKDCFQQCNYMVQSMVGFRVGWGFYTKIWILIIAGKINETTKMKYGYIFGECSGCSFVRQKEIICFKIRLLLVFNTCVSQKKAIFGGKLIIKISINAFVLHHAFLPTYKCSILSWTYSVTLRLQKRRLSANQLHWLSAARLHRIQSWKQLRNHLLPCSPIWVFAVSA